MDIDLGVPSPHRPRCAAGHRERYMEYRKRLYDGAGGWKCGKCGHSMTHIANLDAPHNKWWMDRRRQQMERLANGEIL